VRRGRAFWKQLSDEVDRGERIADVARRHGVQPRTLTWWRWKLGTLPRVEARFLPVVIKQPVRPVDPRDIELCIRDVTIRIGSDTDVSYVAALVDALRGRC
jgi:transposase